MTPEPSPRSPWRIALGGLVLTTLAALARPEGQAAPLPRPGPTWPKTTPADRAQSERNLKQIALAFHNYHDVFGRFPGAAILGKDGKALLSWRVAILPFVDEDVLYKQFRLNEAWDSPHNKKLLARRPAFYGLPSLTGKWADLTFYRVFTGPATPFNPALNRPGSWPLGLGIATVAAADGASNTLLVVEAGEAVPWSKPDELPYDPRKRLPRVGGLFPEGFHAALVDGSVRFLARKIDEKTLRALITPAGGEVIDWTTIPLARPPARRK
jgi:hypothetical protein